MDNFQGSKKVPFSRPRKLDSLAEQALCLSLIVARAEAVCLVTTSFKAKCQTFLETNLGS